MTKMSRWFTCNGVASFRPCFWVRVEGLCRISAEGVKSKACGMLSHLCHKAVFRDGLVCFRLRAAVESGDSGRGFGLDGIDHVLYHLS